MKKTIVSGNRSMVDANIDQYCQSVAELLKNINENAGTRPHMKTPDEPQHFDYSEDLFQY